MKKPTRHLPKTISSFDCEHSNPMSHEEALEMNAVELYVLNDLSPAQELRFEEHYFSCQECACGVAVEQALISNKEPSVAPEPWWRRFSFPLLAPLTAALLGMVFFQYSKIAELANPLPNTVIVAQAAIKGQPLAGRVVPTPSVTVELNLPADITPSPFYRVVLLGEGKRPISKVVPAPEGSRLSLQVLSRTLSSGSYNVIVYGLPRQDSPDGPQIGQYFFNIQIGD